jgi:hypothetical protein
MKAWFVMKDGEVVGNPLGYKSERSAKKYIYNCDDRSDKWFEYSQVTYGKYYGAEDIPEGLKESGIFAYQYSMPSFMGLTPTRGGWFVSYPVWEKNVWKPYVQEHYEIREREYEIVFKN